MSSSLSTHGGRKDALLRDIYLHGASAAWKNPGNAAYCDQVMERTAKLRELIEGGSGIVKGVVNTSFNDVQWLAEVAFGREVSEEDIYVAEGRDDLEGYDSTVLPGLLGRLRYVSTCRTDGPIVAFDFLGAGD